LRISATHRSISPNGPTLSIRVSRPYLALTPDNFYTMAPIEILKLLNIFVKAHTSIVLSAETGAGKTELQKLLLGFVPFEDRIVLVEDTDEMHLPAIYPDKDIFSWVSNAGIVVANARLTQQD
jgi:pilus assembly protein CpaF